MAASARKRCDADYESRNRLMPRIEHRELELNPNERLVTMSTH